MSSLETNISSYSKPETTVYYNPYVIEDICSQIVIKPAVLQDYATQPHIWLNAHDRLPTDGSALLPIAEAKIQDCDRLSSAGVDVKWSSDSRKAGVLYQFNVNVYSVEGASGDKLNHGSGVALTDEQGHEIATAPFKDGNCVLETTNIRFYGQYGLRYKHKLEQVEEQKLKVSAELTNEKKRDSLLGDIVNAVRGKGKGSKKK